MMEVRFSRMMKKTFYHFFIPFVIALSVLISDVRASDVRRDSLEFNEFSKKISKIFDQEKITSIISKLPPKFKIFGYDIGDIDGDSQPDLVLSARDAEDKKKNIGIYFFINMVDSFRLANVMDLQYYGQPIEVAFSIENGVCFITRKAGEYQWSVSGYQIRNMIFREVDEWKTRRLNYRNNLYDIGYDTYHNFETLRSTEHFFRAEDNKTYLKASFSTLPVYHATRRIPKLFPQVIDVSSASFILSGSSSWFGSEDLSFTISARYDSNTITFHVHIVDDHLLSTQDPSKGDVFELWFDLSGRRKVEATYVTYLLRDSSASEVLGVKVAMGNQRCTPKMLFIDRRLTKQQREQLSKIKLTSAIDTSGSYILDVIFPKEAFDTQEKNDNTFGFTAVYRDVDNTQHPDWITVAATSDNFVEASPKTFGAMKFIGAGEYFGDTQNLHLNVLLAKMRSAGMMY